MSFVATRWAWHPEKLVSPHEKLVLLLLAKYANKDKQCWPSQKTISSQTGIPGQEVREIMRSLHDLELIKSERGDGRMTYTLLFEEGSS